MRESELFAGQKSPAEERSYRGMSTEYGLFWGRELYNYKDEKKILIEHLLYERDCMCISSKSGVGKSVLAKQLICNLTTGTPFLGTYNIPEPLNVLYVQTEGDRAETLERMSLLRKNHSIDNSKWVHLNFDGMELNTNAGHGIDWFLEYIKTPQMNYDIIILDPLYTTVKGTMSSDEVATDWIRNVRKIRRTYNCAMIILHHEGKEQFFQGKSYEKADDNVFGSVYWNAFFNQNFKFKRYGDMHILKRGKQRSNKIVDEIKMRMEDTAVSLQLVHYDQITSGGNTNAYDFIHNSDLPVSAKDIEKGTEIAESTLYRTLNHLENERRIIGKKIIRTKYYVSDSKYDSNKNIWDKINKEEDDKTKD